MTLRPSKAPRAGVMAGAAALLVVPALLAMPGLRGGAARALDPPPASAKAMIAEVVRTGSVIVAGITFEKGREAPAASSESSLGALRTMLAEHDEWTFEVQVHSAETGDPSRDQSLSAMRARAVVAWLTRGGIASQRLVARGYGSSRPLAGDARVPNDRVELRKLNEE